VPGQSSVKAEGDQCVCVCALIDVGSS